MPDDFNRTEWITTAEAAESEVGGPDKAIVVVSREEGSGTCGAFEEMVMGEEVSVDTAILQPSNSALKTTVSTTEDSRRPVEFGGSRF